MPSCRTPSQLGIALRRVAAPGEQERRGKQTNARRCRGQPEPSEETVEKKDPIENEFALDQADELNEDAPWVGRMNDLVQGPSAAGRRSMQGRHLGVGRIDPLERRP
jgi:hypothetical protein